MRNPQERDNAERGPLGGMSLTAEHRTRSAEDATVIAMPDLIEKHNGGITMSEALTTVTKPTPAVAESALIKGDLKNLTEDQRVNYYMAICNSIGLNPLTKPFEYLELDGKMVLYAKRDATDQLRKIHGVSIELVEKIKSEGLYSVTARARTADGRQDEAIGAVPLEKEGGEWRTAQSGKRYFAGNGDFKPIRGDALANALMKAETKAKRRVTLSICGLGMLDETEIETIPSARVVEAKQKEPQQQQHNDPDNQPDKELVDTLEKLYLECKCKVDVRLVGQTVKQNVDKLTSGGKAYLREIAAGLLDCLPETLPTEPASPPPPTDQPANDDGDVSF